MATAKTRRVIEVDVTADPGARKAIGQINSQLRSMEGAAKKTQREVTRMSSSFNLMSIAAKGYIALRVVTAITDTSDAMILLGARLNIVTEETVGVEQAFDDLFDIANKTRQSIEATGTLYARLGFATKTLNLEHQDLLDIVQGVNNTLLLSGASAQEAASSIIQLSQAFSKGSLDGDEFRSVSEGNVILFGIMQDVLDKTARELRQFSRDGELSGELLAKILTSDQVERLQARVDEIPMTFAQAFTQIKNSFSELVISIQPIFVDLAESFSSVAKGISAYITIGRGFSQDIISVNEFLLQGNGTLEQRLELAAFINRELGFQRDITKRHRDDVRLGIDDERERLAVINEQIRVTETKLIAPKRITDNPLQFSGIVVVEAEETTRDVNEILVLQNKIKESLENQITLAIKQEQIDSDRLDIIIEQGRLRESLRNEFDKLAESVRTPLQIMNDELENLEKFQGLDFNNEELVISAATTQSVEKYLAALKKLEPELDEATKRSKEFAVAIGQTLADGIGDATDSVFDFITGLETHFSDAINNMLNDIGRLIFKLIVLRGIEESLSGSPVGNFLFPSVTGSAQGNVFNQGNVTAFATGGVIDQPTFFPMNSGVGLLGEAGPEAILPLKRGAGGDLGVTVEGGSAKNVSVSIENKGSNESRIVESSATTDINGTVIAIVIDDIRRGGPIRDAVKTAGEY